MESTNFTLKEMRAEFKANGFKLEVVQYENFNFVEIIHTHTGLTCNMAARAFEAFLFNREALELAQVLRAKYKDKTFDVFTRITM